VAGGLPRVNRLTDLYNAVSVLHQIPLGIREGHLT
jgi:DNA/RNA-binding domain of Phe-tRNA-synthetase-like protein